MACFPAFTGMKDKLLDWYISNNTGFFHGYIVLQGLIFALWLARILLSTSSFVFSTRGGSPSALCHKSLWQCLRCWAKVRPSSLDQLTPMLVCRSALERTGWSPPKWSWEWRNRIAEKQIISFWAWLGSLLSSNVEILEEYVVSCFALLKLLLISISHRLFNVMQEFFASNSLSCAHFW